MIYWSPCWKWVLHRDWILFTDNDLLDYCQDSSSSSVGLCYQNWLCNIGLDFSYVKSPLVSVYCNRTSSMKERVLLLSFVQNRQTIKFNFKFSSNRRQIDILIGPPVMLLMVSRIYGKPESTLPANGFASSVWFGVLGSMINSIQIEGTSTRYYTIDIYRVLSLYKDDMVVFDVMYRLELWLLMSSDYITKSNVSICI